ncbi:complex I NDUFA9 subunit family protein [Aquincola sp. S2]|uniref:Complex I NDUFA9 subunit family protein n=1 Tax=Pseudaquabacterium terrae TaxID=2732868 RepID=A0ABX2EDR1_9BURK|nr:complex I NDUFA9 subunit family protein [Aquabacterium terrae]NRF66718.1 complex I NDUFA9 subunit family protein [Aquabacterium terrae]
MARRIVVTGGTGFVGRVVCERLFERDAGTAIVVPTRQLPRGNVIRMLPTVELVRCNVHEPQQLAAVFDGADTLIHLVAILHGTAQAFEQVHVALPRKLAAACRAAGVQRVVHVSALGVATDAPSAYLRSKAAGEAVWRDSGLDVTIVRPSVIFGAEDRFTNLFVRLQRLFPVLPLAGADALFQPVWVSDVARAIVASVDRPAPAGGIVEIAGPEVLSLKQIVQHVGRLAGCERPVLPLPEAIGRVQAALMALLPGTPLMSADNLLSMRVPNVASGALPGLAELGLRPATIDILGAHFAR